MGKYAYNNGNPKSKEVVAESLVKIISSCIGDDNLKMLNSPKEVFDSYPDEFKKIIEKSIG